MTEVDIALGLITAGSALYGFVVAYYVFARLLQNQEKWQAEYRFRSDWKMGSEDDFQQARGAILLRLIWLNVFLVTASVVFVISLTSNISFVFAGDSGRFLVGLIFFGGLVWVVFSFFIYIGVQNLLEILPHWRESRKKKGKGAAGRAAAEAGNDERDSER